MHLILLYSLELLGDALTDGILGYISKYLQSCVRDWLFISYHLAIGVNASASYNITNTNYLNSSTTASVSESISSVSETATSSFIARALGL